MNEHPALIPGTWRSEYEYESSSRGQTLTGEHDVQMTISRGVFRFQSLPGSPSRLEIELTFREPCFMGTWVEHTDPAGYYAGHVFFGTAVFLLDLTEEYMSLVGAWIGAGREATTVSTGPWTLTRRTSESRTHLRTSARHG